MKRSLLSFSSSLLSVLAVTSAAALAQDAPPVVREAPRAQEAAPVQMEVFDVRDLTGQNRLDALARDIVSDAVSTETRIVLLERYREMVESGEVRSAMENLVAAIEELAQPAFQGPDKSVVALDDGQLAVSGREAQCVWVRGFLAELRRDASPITVRSRVVLLPKGELAKLLPGNDPRFVGAEELAGVRERTAQHDTLTCPMVTVRPGQRASLSAIDQTAYIKDFSVEVVNGQEIVDPEIAVLNTGLELDVRVAPVAPGQFALKSELTLTSAKRPFPNHTVRVGSRQTEVTIQLPEVTEMNVEGRFDVALGTAVLLGGFGPEGAPVLHGEGETDKEVLLVIEVLRDAAQPANVRARR